MIAYGFDGTSKPSIAQFKPALMSAARAGAPALSRGERTLTLTLAPVRGRGQQIQSVKKPAMNRLYSSPIGRSRSTLMRLRTAVTACPSFGLKPSFSNVSQ